MIGYFHKQNKAIKLIDNNNRFGWMPLPVPVHNLIRKGSSVALAKSHPIPIQAPMIDRVLTRDTLNPNLVRAQYAVRGELAIRAEELRNELQASPGSLPFEKIVFCNIGNPQQLGQKPLTYFRQILSLVEYPELISASKASGLFPSDVVKRAQKIINSLGSTGAYTHSQGIPAVRESIARYIESRDGVPSNSNHIHLTNGASDAISRIMECILTGPNVGVMIPIPQYPLYSALIALLNGKGVSYYLDESSSWSLQMSELERAINAARTDGIDVRAMCIINPGNPTGNCFTHDTLKDIIAFCKKQRLVLLADEVYQTNVYGEKPFIAARKVAAEMGEAGEIEIFSFHSISKGLVGECGHRGGYYECFNIDPFVLEQLYKQSSICLCSNVAGQILLNLMVDPPHPQDPSYELYEAELGATYDSLKKRSIRMRTALESMTDVTCNEAAGAMYLFPRLCFPQRLHEHVRLLSKGADEIYAMELLNATGICVVPGSGFGQVPGTFHLRTTFLPREEDFDAFIALWKDFHEKFMSKWK